MQSSRVFKQVAPMAGANSRLQTEAPSGHQRTGWV